MLDSQSTTLPIDGQLPKVSASTKTRAAVRPATGEQGMTSPRKSRTQEERNAAARSGLSKAALELFAIKGYDSTSLADIGTRAGYSRSLVKYHFGSKAQLAESLLDDMGHRILQLSALNLADDARGEDAWAALHQHLHDSWAQFRSSHDDSGSNLAARGEMILNATATFSLDEGMRMKLKVISDGLIDRISHVLNICIRDHIIRDDINVRATALFYASSIWSMTTVLFAAHENRDDALGMEKSLRFFLQSLRTKET